MPKITTEMIEAVYDEAKEVYLKKQKENDALDILKNVYKWNESSALYYIISFKAMMDGRLYTRTISSEATKYFFKSIRSDFGPDELKNALDAAQEHVDYYASLESGGNQNKIRRLIETYRAELATEK